MQVLYHPFDALKLRQMRMRVGRSQGYDIADACRIRCLKARAGIFHYHTTARMQAEIPGGLKIDIRRRLARSAFIVTNNLVQIKPLVQTEMLRKEIDIGSSRASGNGTGYVVIDQKVEQFDRPWR